MTSFEFDPEKSRINHEKHGIDFIKAQRLWDDPHFTVRQSPYADEIRYLGIGRIDEIIWTAIFTTRGSKIRLISVRRARYGEKDLYQDDQRRRI